MKLKALAAAVGTIAALLTTAPAAVAAPATPRCVITVTKHFTNPPADRFYIQVTHPCTGEKARVLATCLHYQSGKPVRRTPEAGAWVTAMSARSSIGCRLGAYTRERWQRYINGVIYTIFY